MNPRAKKDPGNDGADGKPAPQNPRAKCCDASATEVSCHTDYDNTTDRLKTSSANPHTYTLCRPFVRVPINRPLQRRLKTC